MHKGFISSFYSKALRTLSLSSYTLFYLTHRSHMTIITLFLMAGSVEISSSLAKAAIHFLARLSFCRHSFPVTKKNDTVVS